jgi:calcitonin receptor-like
MHTVQGTLSAKYLHHIYILIHSARYHVCFQIFPKIISKVLSIFNFNVKRLVCPLNKLRQKTGLKFLLIWQAVRATLILIPLLGLHYLLIPFRPKQGTPEAAIYDVVSAGVASLQVHA